MNIKQFFEQQTIRKKFFGEDIQRVQNWMQGAGYLKDPEVLPGEAATAVILLSMTCTEADLESFGHAILQSQTDYKEPETLQEILAFILSDETNGLAIEAIHFDRMKGRVTMSLVDGSEILVTTIRVPIRAEWKQPGGISWNKTELIILASNLAEIEYIEAGEILSDADFKTLMNDLNDH